MIKKIKTFYVEPLKQFEIVLKEEALKHTYDESNTD